ncbi:MAG: LysM peptidoglycan-binding domain-containing protein [Planctomycetaceae bacterium]|nr:LysM peptidoglycan-binding domain-containing protein [Planctomycetales bacterium]MCB9874050.1 LysM peptidoglycan-binding domain-containing protein [Planctomycetaceae bacterium]MCB9937696.1 LysM peptidoglycan-binding domain-containing protein [Planctomycetaceae bacterium]HRX80704.1 LysM peptidoglycan-binding domain-containing protein [Pirellulaceae bacterium]
MVGWKRRILGLIVISGGVCAALPFRYDAPNSMLGEQSESEVSRTPSSQPELTLQLTIPVGPDMMAAPEGEPRVTPAVLELPLTHRATAPTKGEIPDPPQLGSTFELFVGSTTPVAIESSQRENDADEPARTHRINDGDTLQSLAARYLGDRTEWQSIFEMNSELLIDPDLLPIGKVITIPRTIAPSPRENHADDVDDGLVPIPQGLLNRESQ